MKKLCYVCEATQGGVRKHLLELLRAFAQPAGEYHVHLLLGDRREPGFREELAALERQSRVSHEFIPHLQRSIRPWHDSRAYAEVKSRLKALAPDLIHTHSSKAGFLGRHAAHHLGIGAVLHTPHVFPFQWSAGLRSRIYIALERQSAKCCRAIVCVAESQRQAALAAEIAPPEKLVVICNGLILPQAFSNEERGQLRQRLKIPENAPAVGMVARLAVQKGVGIFVRAAAAIARRSPNAVFLLVGGGPLEDEIRQRAAALGLGPAQFRLLGHREDAAALYPAFDVLVLSSLYEGLPYVLLEAMAFGVPVIATDVVGSQDVVVDGQTGFLTRPHDPNDIAERTLQLLQDPALRARQSSAARQRAAEQFDFRSFIDGHRQLYNRVLSSHPTAPKGQPAVL